MGSWWRTLCLTVVAASLTSCAVARARLDVHEEGWLLVETEHIALQTDLAREPAIARARQLEQYWQVLARMYVLFAPGAKPPAGRFAAVHLDSCVDLRRFRSRAVSGFAIHRPDWLSSPIAITCEAYGDHVFVHELAHVFNHHHFSGLPPWVQEGLATYYSSITVRDGKALVGRAPALAGCVGPSLEDLRRMDHEQFHTSMYGQCSSYYSAWKLVHLLSATGVDRRERFRRYLGALPHSGTSEEAWAKAFGDLPPGHLETDYDEFHQRLYLNGWTTPFAYSEQAPPRVRPLLPREAHLLWLNLLPRDHKSELAAQLQRLVELEPDWPDVLYWRAVLLEGPDAIRLLRDYVARRPDDERGWRALVHMQLDNAVPADHLGLDGTPPPGLAAMEGDVQRLIGLATDARSFNEIAYYFAMRRKPVDGLRFGTRAVRARPACGSCWDTVGLLFFQAGKFSQALKAQERAAGQLGHHAAPGVLARLRRYRAAVASGK